MICIDSIRELTNDSHKLKATILYEMSTEYNDATKWGKTNPLLLDSCFLCALEIFFLIVPLCLGVGCIWSHVHVG